MIAARKTQLASVYAGCASEANQVGPAIVLYIQTNATANISTGTNLHLVVPTPNTSGTALANPSSGNNLPIT